MVVPEGYKQTEAGVIPNDWCLCELQEYFDIFAGGDVDKKHFSALRTKKYKYPIFSNSLVKFVYGYTDFPRYKGNSITITGRGFVGVAIYRESDFDAIIRLLILTPKIDGIINSYFSAEYINNNIVFPLESTGVPQLTVPQIKNAIILLPPFQEQTAIAGALSDADALITSLEKLIVKKKHIKKGAMQELLTGKRRLPGFSGEWVEIPLREVAYDIIRGQGLSKSQIEPNGKYKCILYGELFTTYDEVIVEVKSKTNYNIGVLSRYGDILLPSTTTTIGIDLANASALMCDNVLLGGDINIVRINNVENNSVVIAYLLTHINKQAIALRAKGITVYHLHANDLKEIIVMLPPTKDEQTAIAAILSDMDAELDALTVKLNKARLIKQGMMQELLTGRIRLVEQAAEVAPAAKVIAFPKQEPKSAAAQSGGHSQQFDDAVMIAGIVNTLYSDKFPLGRKKVQKCLYLLRRRQDESTATFKKKAAGPYADEVRYKGGEPIAKNAHYIATTTVKGKGTTFARGSDIGKALSYIDNWGKKSDIKWVADKLKYKKVDELELLATVDMAICDLEDAGRTVSIASIKHLIATNEEWKAKLKKQTFSDTNIARAIRELQTLLQGEN